MVLKLDNFPLDLVEQPIVLLTILFGCVGQLVLVVGSLETEHLVVEIVLVHEDEMLERELLEVQELLVSLQPLQSQRMHAFLEHRVTVGGRTDLLLQVNEDELLSDPLPLLSSNVKVLFLL